MNILGQAKCLVVMPWDLVFKADRFFYQRPDQG